MKSLLFAGIAILFFASCSENYSNGERIGLISKFSQKGAFWKSWEGDMVLTQTGMNQSANNDFEFSVDNDHEDANVIKMLDSAVNLGWKVKLTYHETIGKNWFENRGNTSHFITGVQIMDRDIVKHEFGGTPVGGMYSGIDSVRRGKVIDTIYVVIFKDKPTSTHTNIGTVGVLDQH